MYRTSLYTLMSFALGAFGLGLVTLVESGTTIDVHTETCRITSITKSFDNEERAQIDAVKFRCPSSEVDQWLFWKGKTIQKLERLEQIVPFMDVDEKFECTVLRLQGDLTGRTSRWRVQTCWPILPRLNGLP